MAAFGRRTVIGVMGGADPGTNSPFLEKAEETGRRIAQAGAVLLCGGRMGIMEAVARGAKSVVCGETVAVLPGPDTDHANPYMDHVIATDMGNARNTINVLSSDSVIAFPGGAGTLSEIALAVKNSIHTVSLGSWDLRAAAGGAAFDSMRPYFHVVQTPEEAVRKALQHARKPVPDSSQLHEALKKVLAARADAWNSGDANAFLENYIPTDELVVTIRGQIARGMESVGALIEEECSRSGTERPGMSSKLKSFIMTNLPGRCMVVSYECEDKDDAGWKCTSVFAPWNGSYKVIADHL